MNPQTITATEAARAFSELLNRVRHEHQSFVILRGGERVARIEPASPPTAPTGFELDRLLAEAIPRLGAEEATCFGADILTARAQLDGRERAWD
jgi:prevent-host-death family protein